MNTYSIDYDCTNCGCSGRKELPRGTTVPNTFECPNCGCKAAHKTNGWDKDPWPEPKRMPWKRDDYPKYVRDNDWGYGGVRFVMSQHTLDGFDDTTRREVFCVN